MEERPTYLLGPMGAGKTTTGKKLADLTGLPFLDLDVFIEQETGKSISTLFQEKGEVIFRKLEAEMLRKTPKQGIIATGGGTPCFHENMDWMLENGHCIYLAASPDLLAKRLSSERSHRPLIANLEESKILDFLADMIRDRSPWYERAQLCIFQEDPKIEPAPLIWKYLLKPSPR